MPTDHDHPATPAHILSPAGQARREEILAGLHQELRRSVRRQKAARRAAVVGAAALALAAGLVVYRSTTTITPPQQIAGGGTEHSPRPASPDTAPPLPVSPAPVTIALTPPPSAVTIRIISTPPGGEVLAPCGATPAPGVCLLDDRQLLAALAETGGSYGLIRTGGKAVAVRNDP